VYFSNIHLQSQSALCEVHVAVHSSYYSISAEQITEVYIISIKIT